MKNDRYIKSGDNAQVFSYGDTIKLTARKIIRKDGKETTCSVPIEVVLDGASIPPLLELGIIEERATDDFTIVDMLNGSEKTEDAYLGIKILSIFSKSLAKHFLLRLYSIYLSKVLCTPILCYDEYWRASSYDFSLFRQSLSKDDVFQVLGCTGIFPSKESLATALEKIDKFLENGE